MNEMINEVMDVMEPENLGNLIDELRQEHRRLFFRALGKEDDGRMSAVMTAAEFAKFGKKVIDEPKDIEGKTTVQIYFKFESYQDVTYEYCFEDDVVWESRFSIGD